MEVSGRQAPHKFSALKLERLRALNVCSLSFGGDNIFYYSITLLRNARTQISTLKDKIFEVTILISKVKENSTRRVRLHRQKMKADGFKSVYVSITPEHKEILDKLCKSLKISQASLISYLLDCAEDRILPKTDEPYFES